MKLIKNTIYTFTLITLFITCGKEDSITPVYEESTNNVFANPVVGCQSKFIRFEGESFYNNENPNYEYVGDTIIVTVLEHSQNGFLIREEYSPFSITKQNGSLPLSPVEYFFSKNEEIFLFSDYTEDMRFTSLMLRGHNNSGDGLELELNPATSCIAEQKGWSVNATDNDDFEQTCKIDVLTFKNYNFEKLDIFFDLKAMAYDGPGYTWIYSKELGLVRFYETSSWTGTAIGWDFLPKEDRSTDTKK